VLFQCFNHFDKFFLLHATFYENIRLIVTFVKLSGSERIQNISVQETNPLK